jgi:hypothetical protein
LQCPIAGIVHFADALKKDYADSCGLDYERLVSDRDYKEMHRPAMTKFYLERFSRDSFHYPRIAFHQAMEVAARAPPTAGGRRVVLLPDFRQPDDERCFRLEAGKLNALHGYV